MIDEQCCLGWQNQGVVQTSQRLETSEVTGVLSVKPEVEFVETARGKWADLALTNSDF